MVRMIKAKGEQETTRNQEGWDRQGERQSQSYMQLE